MAQVIDSIPTDCLEYSCCCYVNASSKIQVVRITNIANWYFERVAFPGQRLIFEAPLHALLEVHCGMMASAILSDTIPCDRLLLESDDAVAFASPLRDEVKSGDVKEEEAIEQAEVRELQVVSSSLAS